MTDHKELIARLRELGIRSADEAADALEAMERERDNERFMRKSIDHALTESALKTEAAQARIAKLEEALKDARESIIHLKNQRWSEIEGTDAEWVAEIDAALGGSHD